MYQGIQDKRCCSSFVGIPFFRQGPLYVPSPEQFFGRTYEQEQQCGKQSGRSLAFYAVNEFHLRPGKAEDG